MTAFYIGIDLDSTHMAYSIVDSKGKLVEYGQSSLPNVYDTLGILKRRINSEYIKATFKDSVSGIACSIAHSVGDNQMLGAIWYWSRDTFDTRPELITEYSCSSQLYDYAVSINSKYGTYSLSKLISELSGLDLENVPRVQLQAIAFAYLANIQGASRDDEDR